MTVCPLSVQCALLGLDSSHGGAPTEGRTFLPAPQELRTVSAPSRGVNYPDELAVEGVPRTTLFGPDVRVLKLDCPPSGSFHICDVLLAAVGALDDLLPVVRELPLPGSVPFRLVLPPLVADPASLMGPMPHLDLATPCGHRKSAHLTLA